VSSPSAGPRPLQIRLKRLWSDRHGRVGVVAPGWQAGADAVAARI